MLAIILMIGTILALFLGTFGGITNALNIAEFLMWTTAITYLLAMIVPEKSLMDEDHSKIYRWTINVLTILTIGYCVFWGYFWAPTFMGMGFVVLYARRYEIQNKPVK